MPSRREGADDGHDRVSSSRKTEKKKYAQKEVQLHTAAFKSRLLEQRCLGVRQTATTDGDFLYHVPRLCKILSDELQYLLPDRVNRALVGSAASQLSSRGGRTRWSKGRERVAFMHLQV